MVKLKKNNGITLVAFLLLIIAIIIIVVVSVLALRGENGLMHTSKSNKIAKDRKEIEHLATLVFNSEIISTNINGDFLRLHHILDKLEESGYKIVEVSSSTNKNAKVSNVLLDKEDLVIKPGENQEVNITINKEDTITYFVESRKIYFEISLTSDGVIIGDGITSAELKEFSNEVYNDDIELNVTGDSITAQLDESTINITANKQGTSSIDVYVNGSKYTSTTVQVVENKK